MNEELFFEQLRLLHAGKKMPETVKDEVLDTIEAIYLLFDFVDLFMIKQVETNLNIIDTVFDPA